MLRLSEVLEKLEETSVQYGSHTVQNDHNDVYIIRTYMHHSPTKECNEAWAVLKELYGPPIFFKDIDSMGYGFFKEGLPKITWRIEFSTCYII